MLPVWLQAKKSLTESQPTAELALTTLTSASEIMKIDQGFHDEKPFLQQTSLLFTASY